MFGKFEKDKLYTFSVVKFLESTGKESLDDWIKEMNGQIVRVIDGENGCVKGNYVLPEWCVEARPLYDGLPLISTMVSSNFYPEKKSKNIGLPKDVDEVRIPSSKNIVIVKLTDGSIGKSKCMHGDTFDVMVGFKNAYYNAKNEKVGTLKKVLENCVKSADKKGYKVAILKNKNR